jgi:prepilin-type N-terminal cleavage/methylation domain-containing protein
MSTRHTSSEAGFTLIETIVAMAIMLVVMGGVFSAMTTAMEANTYVKQMTAMNSSLGTSMDAIVRDLLQVGQGLPVGRRIEVPNGPGANPIIRPGPGQVGQCQGVTSFPVASSIAAVSAGANLGPAVNGVCTDVITVLMADSTFESAGVASIADTGASLIVDDDWDISGGATVTDDLRAGDLLMLSKGSYTTLMTVSGVVDQTVTFAVNDTLRLNQFDAGLNMQGTINQLRASAPVDPTVPQVDPNNGARTIPGPTLATRIRMITYYVDTVLNPNSPRLMRIVGGGTPQAVGFDVHGLTFSYDLFNGDTNPVGVRMTPANLASGGPCGIKLASMTDAVFESTCANRIRKVNVMLAMRSENINRRLGDYQRNTLFTQVSLRNLSFQDQY